MNKPSVKTLESAFPGKGKAIRLILDSIQAVDENPAVKEWVKQCYGYPKDYERRLEALNDVMDGHGVEYVPAGRNKKSPAFHYVNMGDTYATTIIRLSGGRYIVSSWGDIVERGNYE